MFGHYAPGQGYFGKGGQDFNGLTKSLTGAVASAGAFASRTIGRMLTSAVMPTSTWVRQVTRAIGRSLASGIGNCGKRVQRGLVGTVTASGVLDLLKVRLVALSGSVASAGALARVCFRRLTGAVNPTGSITRRIARLLAGLLTPNGFLAQRHRGETTVTVALGGTDRTSNIRLGSLEVEDVLNDAPNRCTFTCVGYMPTEGEVVQVLRGPTAEREFAGHVMSVQQFYEGILANVAYHVTCQDYTWKLNRRRVTKRWVNTSASTIAQQIISGFTSGITSNNVVLGLATVPEFRCDNELPSRALQRLCAEIGGNFYIDYALDLHFFLTETSEAPNDISDATLATTTARGLAHTGDVSQVRTRMRGIGHGTSALEHISSTDTSIPVESAEMFESNGGSLKNTENEGAYTGRHLGGVASTVLGNVAGPASAPSANVASGVVGVLAGIFKYKIAFANAQGETTPGPESGSVTGTAFAPPTNANVAASGAIGPLVGAYLYVTTYVTSLGETTAGASFGRTATAVAAPGAPSLAAAGTIGRLIGNYGYRVAFKTPFGITEGGSIATRTASGTAAGSTPSASAISNTLGNLVGAYSYRVTFGSPFGESAPTSAGGRTASTPGGPGAPTCTATAIGPLKGTYHYKVGFVDDEGREILGGSATSYTHNGSQAATPSVGSTGGATGLNIRIRVCWIHPIYGESSWSDAAELTNHGANVNITANALPSGCTWQVFSTGSFSGAYAGQPYFRMPTVYTASSGALDTVSGAVATSAAGTMGGNCSISGISTGPNGTDSRRVYRTRVGAGSGGAYYLVGQINDNSTTTFNDVVPDQALQSGPLYAQPGEQHTVTVPTGPTGTTRRYVYRTEAGGSAHYLLRTLEDNVTTSFTDNAKDVELDKSRQPSASATSGEQISLTNIPTGPSGTISRLIYRTEAGGSVYRLLIEIADNSTTSYTDNKADTELGAETARGTSTAGGQAHSLTSIPVGPTGTLARRIYRTVAGGTSYQFVGELTDNVSTTFTDAVADSALGHYIPLTNTAGANKIALTSIPTGGAGVTKRIIYRTEAGGSVFRYVATLDDNSATTYTDNTPDTSLGREALTQSTIGAITGDTSLLLSSVTGWPTVGWLKAGSLLVRWNGISGTTLTGIPGGQDSTITRSGTTATVTTTGSHGFATNDVVTIQGAEQSEYNGSHKITVTGSTTFTYTIAGSPATPATGTIKVYAVGAILAPIQGGSGVVTAPFLSGVSGLTYPVDKGGPVRIMVVRNDSAAQAALAAVEGGDGVHEELLDEPSIETVAQLTAACDAELAAYSRKLRTITFRSRDPKLRSGKTVTLNLGAPTNISGSFLIQRVISTEFDTAPYLNPMREVIAAPVRLSFETVLRRSRESVM